MSLIKIRRTIPKKDVLRAYQSLLNTDWFARKFDGEANVSQLKGSVMFPYIGFESSWIPGTLMLVIEESEKDIIINVAPSGVGYFSITLNSLTSVVLWTMFDCNKTLIINSLILMSPFVFFFFIVIFFRLGARELINHVEWYIKSEPANSDTP